MALQQRVLESKLAEVNCRLTAGGYCNEHEPVILEGMARVIQKLLRAVPSDDIMNLSEQAVMPAAWKERRSESPESKVNREPSPCRVVSNGRSGQARGD